MKVVSVTKLWLILGGLEVLFVVFFTIFILSINREYINTFFTRVTAKQFAIQRFREAKSDSAKIEIFKKHKSFHSSIRDEVEEWARDNWLDWEEEKPEWFTKRVRASVPKDMIPASLERGSASSQGAY